MARRGDAALKRAREKARLEKQAAKREKKAAREAENAAAEPVNEQALMEAFALLSQRYENNEITSEQYETERQRIFGKLGIESEH